MSFQVRFYDPQSQTDPGVPLLICNLEPSPDEGEDLSNVVGRQKAEDLLSWMGKPGWRPLDESLKAVSDFILLS